MPRVRLDPKFVYSNGTHDFKFTTDSNIPDNDNLFKPGKVSIFTPQFGLIPVGNSHSERHGNRITVTSLRVKVNMEMNPDFIVDVHNPFTGALANVNNYSYQTVLRFFKFRYMVVEFDEDIVMTNLKLYQWFKRTYCWYEPRVSSADQPDNDPVSVHSNILHETTEWTGKFNILCDKCFSLKSNKPSLSFDITVPMNRQYVYDESDTTGEGLLFPNIWCFIIPPLSSVVDIDGRTTVKWKAWAPFGAGTDITYAKCQYFTKLSFVKY